MKSILLALTAALATATAMAKPTVVSKLPWRQPAAASELTAGRVTTLPNGESVLRVENPVSAPLQSELLTVGQPRISTTHYAVSGEVRYENVEGEGFLEMWSHFGDRSFFSRTLGASGPMEKIKGNSGWRTFTLPFDASRGKMPPDKLVVNLHLPGKGEVYLRELVLVEGPSFAAVMQKPGAWWSDRSAGLIGGVAGAIIGCLGGLVEWLASRGRARRFVVATLVILITVGVLAAVGGIVAVLLRQPYGVWYPLVLLGVLTAGIFPFRLRRYQHRFRDLELRRISSMDLVAQ